MSFVKKTLTLFLFLILGQITAQELPPIETYSPKQYNGENQNWDISQSNEKYIYVANDKGLLEFNGSMWQLYPSPNKTIMRSVNVVGDRIYTGCYMEFGYWKNNSFGQLDYTSLSKNLDISLIEDEQFWSIIALDSWVLFQSLNRIYIYNIIDSSFKTIESKTRLIDIFKVNKTIYFQKLNDGIYKIENGKELKVSDHEILKNNIVVNIFNFENKILLETQEKGFYQLENNRLSKWNIPANDVLDDVSVYSSIQLKDGSYVLGTISHGIIELTADGEIKYKINQINGLSNNTILSLFEDSDNNIWLGSDNGINCVNIKSPFNIFNDEKGNIGTVYTSIVFRENLYLGTNQGLFFKKLNSNEDFKFIEGTRGQVWSLVVLDNTLFCGHNIGTLIIEENKVTIVEMTDGTWNINPIEGHKNLLIQGKYNGLNVLEKINNTWEFRNKVEGFKNASRFVEWHNEREFFVNHEYKGIFNITLNTDYTRAIKVIKDSTIQSGIHSSLLKYKSDILYSSKEGIFKYNEASKSFQKDTIYGRLFDEDTYISGRLVEDNFSSKLWSFTNRSINYLSPGKLSNLPSLHTISLPNSLRNSKIGYENISHISDNKYLLGTSKGFIIIDLDKFQDKTYSISINIVSKSTLNQRSVLVDKTSVGKFGNNENNIGFTYSVPEFDKYLDVEYQYQLEGIYDSWSDWSSNSNELFKNLSFGEYTFNVKARVGNKKATNIASYQFYIEKPWYLSNAIVIAYIFGVLLFSFLTHNIYKRYYRIQSENLLEKTERELELNKLENEQQLMSFKNEKLRDDIESKNRELAISTMSLIKKNEFLNTIKSELNNVDDGKAMKSVVKIIDKNLNNTDDWKLFQEAFNNADKNFLKKVKNLHPLLTPNDLRLCAYLRLNLSSKEIAPLLNISSRSVEVKRYRLRKKMNLSHETSLTNYILEL